MCGVCVLLIYIYCHVYYHDYHALQLKRYLKPLQTTILYIYIYTILILYMVKYSVI